MKQNLIYHGEKTVLIEHHNNITGVTFMINRINIHVPTITLFVNDNIKFLENVK